MDYAIAFSMKPEDQAAARAVRDQFEAARLLREARDSEFRQALKAAGVVLYGAPMKALRHVFYIDPETRAVTRYDGGTVRGYRFPKRGRISR